MEKPMSQTLKLNDQIQSDNVLQLVATHIVSGFDDLYTKLDKMKQEAVDHKQLVQITHIQNKIDNLAQKTLTESQDLRYPIKRSNVELEIENLKQQLRLMQQQHEQLAVRHEDLEKRVAQLQCTMVSREQFQDLKASCDERFSIFENRFQVMKQQNEKLFIYMDEEFKKRIKPSDHFKQKLSELMKRNYRLFEYGRKMYWSLMNQILAYRALSSGMVQKGSIRSSFQSSTVFKEIVSAVSSATYLIAGIPLVGGVFFIVKDLSSLFFNKREQILINNMCLRVQGYFTEDQIAQDVARAVLQLLNNPNIEARLAQFRKRTMIISALCKFFQFIVTADFSPQLLADLFATKLAKLKKQKQGSDNDFIMENVVTDTSLIMWKLAQISPVEKRYAISNAVKSIFCKNISNICTISGNNLQTKTGISAQSEEANKMCFSAGPILQRGFLLQQQEQNQQKQNQNRISCQNKFKSNITLSSAASLPSTAETSQSRQQQVSTQIQRSISNPQVNMNRSSFNAERVPYFKLKVIRADINLKKPLLGRAHLYCTIKYKDKIVTTSLQKTADFKPVWNEEMIFESAEIPSCVTMEIYDRERIFQDDLIGTATILDRQLDKREQEVQIWNVGKLVGKLYICMQA